MASSSTVPAVRSARVSVQIAIPLITVASALPLIGRLYLSIFEPEAGTTPLVEVPVAILQTGPALILAWAILQAGKVLGEYEHGRFLSLAASASLKRVGQSSVIALLLQGIVAPVAVALLRGAPWSDALHFNAFDLGLLMLAGFMSTAGAVLEQAAKALKADSDSIV